MWFNWAADVLVYVSFICHINNNDPAKLWQSPPRGVTTVPPTKPQIILHISPTFLQCVCVCVSGGGGGGGLNPIDKCISSCHFQVKYIFCQREIYIYVWPINSFLLLKLEIFSGNPKNCLGPMVPWSDTFSTPGCSSL